MSAFAGELSVSGDPCASRLDVDARDVPLQVVLDRTSQVLGLTYKADEASLIQAPVTVKRSGTPQAVLKALLGGRNVVIETQPLERCRGAEGVARIWILRAGEDRARIGEPSAVGPSGDLYPKPIDPPRHRRAGKSSGPSHRSKHADDTVPAEDTTETPPPG